MLSPQEFHASLGARFIELDGIQTVADYGDAAAEHRALQESAAILDLGSRSRLCLTGGDRIRFLNGQVTNDVKALPPGGGCYAALVSAKGRIESDLNIYRLETELLLDFEPGLTRRVMERFEHYIIADDVEVTDVAPLYGLLSIQGPKAGEVLRAVAGEITAPAEPMTSVTWTDPVLGELYCMRQPRAGSSGFDLYVPADGVAAVADKLIAAVKAAGGLPCGWDALELHRVEAGIPRFGQDMDEGNLVPETGIAPRAISYSKGCYIGQEVISRIRAYGQVSRTLCGFLLPDDLEPLPAKGTRLHLQDREVGHLTSVVRSPRFRRNIALGYARRGNNEPGMELTAHSDTGGFPVRVVALPFGNL